MRFKFLLLLATVLMFSAAGNRPVRVYMAGDSTMADKVYYKNVLDSLRGTLSPEEFLERGWGQLLPEFLTDEVIVRNFAKNGRSTKTFRAEGWWDKIMNEIQPGDYVIIQFGHNDGAIEKVGRYTTPDEYRANLERFIKETKAKKATPILCTPVMRRKFDSDGKLVYTHGVYPGIVKEVAKQQKVELVDMETQTAEWLTRTGVAGSRQFFHKYAPGESRLFPGGLDDNTHFVEKGARTVAGMFASAIQTSSNTDLKKYLKAEQAPYVSKVWVSDLGNGKYKNPVIYADYSDPDVCRAGEDYYMVSSSFANTPGLPILHSRDMVNWTLIGHALPQLTPVERFSSMQHGNGVWAPSIRYHNNEFYIYYGDPDAGVYMTKASDPKGPWSPLVLVKAGKGLIDAAPLWDEDGRAYVVHGFAGSRAGMKSVLAIFEMTPDGTRALTESRLVFDGHPAHPTIEGPKFHKRNGYYYIFAPAGGVKPGWQLALRSKSVYGPYEEKIVLAQGTSDVNGPHQGAWVDTPDGKEDWFFHFQDLYAYGRVVHLQPMRWVNDWPVMGEDKDGDGCGTPVLTWNKPNVGASYPVATPVENDEFDKRTLGLQWQWQANNSPLWYYAAGEKGYLRLFAMETIDEARNLYNAPHLLLQKLPAPDFKATTKLTFHPFKTGERAGLAIMGQDYSTLSLVHTENGLVLQQTVCRNAVNGQEEVVVEELPMKDSTVYLRVEVKQVWVNNSDGVRIPLTHCDYSYSTDGKRFDSIGKMFSAREGKWIGAKVGVFCERPKHLNDSGYADIDWFRIEK